MKTDTVNTEKWTFNGVATIKTPYQEIKIKPFAEDGENMGELIVAAVNACKEINPDNPLNVASHLVEFVEMYKKLQMELEHFINATPTGDKRVQLTGLNILALLKLSQITE